MTPARYKARRAIPLLLLRALLAVLVLTLLAVSGLLLRLASGPLEVTWLVHRVTPLALGDKAGGGPAQPWARLEIGRAWLAWNGLHAAAPLLVQLQDVAIRRPDGVVADHLDRAWISLDAAALVRRRLSIEEVRISGVRLNLRRDNVRGFDLGLRPLGTGQGGHGSYGPTIDWDHLQRVRISDLQVSVHDLVVGQDWSVRDVELDDRPAIPGTGGSGIVGRTRLTILAAGRQATLDCEGVAVPASVAKDGEVAWRMTLSPVVPAALAGVLPILAPLRALALPVTPVLNVRFANGPGQFMEPMRMTLSAQLGGGELHAAGSTLGVASGSVRLSANLPDGPKDAVELRLRQADLQLRDADDPALPAPMLHMHGTLSLDSLADVRRIRATVVADIPRIGFASLARYWPVEVAVGARRWITANITAGEAHDIHVESVLQSDHGWATLAETGRTGGFDADGLTLWWLRPMAPLRDMHARLSFQGPDALLVETPHALLPVEIAGRPAHALVVSNGSMRITGLNDHEQIATVRLRLAGDLGDLLAELSHPRLRLLSRHPVPFTAPSGATVTDVVVTLPLDDDVSIDAIHVDARSQMTDVHLGDVVAGRSLDHAGLSVVANVDGLTVDGDAMVGSIPARMHYAMDFRDGPPSQLVEQAHVEGTVSTAAVRQEGLDPSDNVVGNGGLTVDYAAHRSGAAVVQLGLDMTDLGIDTRIWSKRRGRPAAASASIGLQHGRLVSVDRIHAAGPGLAVEARAVVADGRTRQVVVARFTVGRTSGAGQIDLPGGTGRKRHAPIRVTAHGAVLDLSVAIDGKPPTPSTGPGSGPARTHRHRPPSAPQPAPQSWTADLSFDRVFVSRSASLTRVVAHVEDDGRRIALARIDAAGPTALSVRLLPDARGRGLAGTAADTGVLLSTLGITNSLSGGLLRLDGRFDDTAPGRPLAGTLSVNHLVVLDAPLAARIVRNLSIYGWLTALPTPQLGIDNLVMPFTLRDQVVTLADARAHSAALGVTLRGPIDLGRSTLDLKGTVVPFWAVNHLPGRLPVVGRLLSPEKGGGVLAATLTIRGRLADPDVHVNALSALVPGLLRRLLFE